MDIRVTYTAIAAAVLFGATTVGQFVENSRLRVEVSNLHTAAVACQNRPGDEAAMRAGLHKFLSGGTPDPATQP